LAQRAACLIVVMLMASLRPVAAQEQGPPPVTVARPLTATVVDHDEYTGRFEAVRQVEVEARVSGYLEEIHFVDGQLVAAGDLLYVIDPRPLEAAVARARAEVARAESVLTLAQLDLGRAEELLPEGATTQETVDTRRATRDTADANVAVALAELRTVELELSFTQITASIAGRVSSTNVDIGNLVSGGSAGTTVLTTIVSENPVHLVFDISEAAFLSYARLNGTGAEGFSADVELRLLDEAEFTRKGRLEFVDNAFDASTGTIRLRAIFDNPDGLLVPGLFGRLRLPASAPYEALLVPDRAIVSDQNDKLVMVVGADNVVMPQKVELGGMHGGLRVVRSGLATDALVVIDGLLMARPGAPVTPQETTLTLAAQD